MAIFSNSRTVYSIDNRAAQTAQKGYIMKMQDIINGQSPTCPQDWNDLFIEYSEFMTQYNPKTKGHKEQKRKFCLTDTGYEINLQWLDEKSIENNERSL